MGKHDSSKTRVVPVFDAVRPELERDSALLKLLSLPQAGKDYSLPAGRDVTVQEIRYGDNEKKLDPPAALLSWLIRHPRKPLTGELSSNPVKAQKRAELIDGSEDRMIEALALLRDNPMREDWPIFEGQTQPDVFIRTPSLLVVVEGKRTEREPTILTKWMPGRHQMLRHIDCAWETRCRRLVRGFFIVEGDGNGAAVPSRWLDFARDTISAPALSSSLPHRGLEEQAEIASCFIGVTTWQRVCREFGIDWAGIRHLPDE